MKKNQSEFRIFILALFVGIISLSFLFWRINQGVDFDGRSHTSFPVVGGDSVDYNIVAGNIVQHGTVSSSRSEPFLPGSFRTPGYPLFIALFIVFGLPLIFLSLAQVFLSACSAVLVYRLGAKFFNETGAFVAAVLFLLDPSLLYYSTIALSDTLFVFLILLVVYLLAVSDEDKKKYFPNVLLAGIILGYAILVRPIAQFLPPLLALWLVVLRWPFNKILIRDIILFLFGCLAVIGPWCWRNYQLFGVAEISSVSSIAFISYNAPMFYAHKTGVSFGEAQKHFHDLVSTSTDGLAFRSSANSAKAKSVALNYLSQDWLGYLRFHLIKTIPFFLTDGLREIARTTGLVVGKSPAVNFSSLIAQGQWLQVLQGLLIVDLAGFLLLLGSGFWGAVVVLVILGFVFLWRSSDRRGRSIVLLCAGLIFYYALLTGPVASARYRLAATAFMFTLAGQAIVALRPKKS